MIDHLEIMTRKLDECVVFYTDVLGPLGYVLQVDERAKGFGDGVTLDFFLIDGEPSSNVHYAFGARDRASVERAYAAAQIAGHTLDRAPSLAPHIHANYYAGYLRDPDGRLVEVVCHSAIAAF
jgi:catechol 2,3-dioxygenase-like lactoylglutathione lyase family enzyme